MKDNLFKKVTAAVLSVTMVVGLAGTVAAATHAANGANVAANCTWTSFSICTREDGGVWEDALKAISTDEYPDGQTYGVDYATEGWFAEGDKDFSSSYFRYYVKNSGWDGEYNTITGDLVADNPWGMTITMTDIPVEKGRTYTISFKIKSTLSATTTADDGTVSQVTTKHILFKAYDPNSNGEPSVSFDTISGADATTGGYLTLDAAQDWQTVTATITVPSDSYGGDTLGIKFALGAMLVSYPDEIAMSGSVYVDDFKITAGTQYAVKYVDSSSNKTVTQYVNAGEKASSYAFTRKGYTLTGYKTSSGTTYNFNSAVNSDITLTTVWTKTKKPAKPKIKLKSTGKKKVKVTIKKKVKNANGYQIQYSKKKNMKGAKKKTTTKLNYVIKKQKSGTFLYVKVRAYNNDSTGAKVYGKLSARKKVYVK